MRPLGARTSRVITVASVVGLASAALAGVAPSVNAASPCLATNLTAGGAVSADLQGVIDAATPGDRVQVEGVCVGNYTIDKDLTVVGKATEETGKATLEGNDAATVLSVSTPTGTGRTHVKLTNLKLTNGRGGIYIDDSAVTLTGSTSVTDNAKPRGAGIFNDHGTVTLNGSSRVTQNDAGRLGGGIISFDGRIILNHSSSVRGNITRFGGGIYIDGGDVRLKGSSTVRGNAAHYGGGIFMFSDGGHVTLNGSSRVALNDATRLGGGISSNGGRITLNNSSTVTRNTAGSDGGGIWKPSAGHLRLNEHSSVIRNTPNNCNGGCR